MAWKESHREESLTEVIVCMRVSTTRQYSCLAVCAAYSRAAGHGMPSFCTSEEFVLLELADFYLLVEVILLWCKGGKGSRHSLRAEMMK